MYAGGADADGVPEAVDGVTEARAVCRAVASAVSTAGPVVVTSATEVAVNASVHRVAGTVSIPACTMTRARLTGRHRRTKRGAAVAVVVHAAPFTATAIPETRGVRLIADALAERRVTPAMVVAPSAVRCPSAEAFISFGEVESDIWISEHVGYILALVRQDWPTTLAEAEVAMTT